MRDMINVRAGLYRLLAVPMLALLLAGCGDDPSEEAPEGAARSLPANLCTWVPSEYLRGLVVNEPTSSEALGVPTSICTAVARKGATRTRYVNVILKRFSSFDEAREDNVEACQTFAKLAPTAIEAPGVQAEETCARRGRSSTYVITVPNDTGDTLLVSIGGTSPAAGLAAATAITNNVRRQLG
jgi:hypothetical protein